MKRTRRPKEYYVNNAKFNEALVEYLDIRREAGQRGDPIPVIPDYIADCLMRICAGLARSHKFVRYTYRDEMVADGIENCLRYIDRFDPDPSRSATGRPNPFAYFTQVAYNAFLSRLKAEKREAQTRRDIMHNYEVEDFACGLDGHHDSNAYNVLRGQLEEVKTNADEAFRRD